MKNYDSISEPNAGKRLAQAINNIFDSNFDKISELAPKHQEAMIMEATSGFFTRFKSTRIFLYRPIPGEESLLESRIGHANPLVYIMEEEERGRQFIADPIGGRLKLVDPPEWMQHNMFSSTAPNEDGSYSVTDAVTESLITWLEEARPAQPY